MKRKIISAMLAFCLILSVIPVNVLAAAQSGTANPASGSFQDVSESDWYYEYVKYATENGIFRGTGEDTFAPDGTMTRGMYVTILGRMAGIQSSAYPYQGTFSDVTADAYYAPYIAWAVKNHIAEGMGDATFAPNGLVTREQMAVFTVRFFDALGIDLGSADKIMTDPKDRSGVSNWAKDPVMRLWKAGILKGDENGNFNPQANSTRAEGTALSMRVHQTTQAGKKQSLPTPPARNSGSSSGGSSGGGTVSSFTVSFQTNGGAAISPMTVSSGGLISNLPTPQKMGFVFLGWYTESSFTAQFTPQTVINSNLTLYAKYAELENVTIAQDERFALVDQDASLSFKLLSSASMTQSEVQSAITLARADASASEALSVTAGSEENAYTVSAVGGFTPGAAYTLTLNNANLTFFDKAPNIRTCSFTIVREVSNYLPLSNSILYIPAAEVRDVYKNGTAVASLSVPLVSNEEITSVTGTFTYSGNQTLSVGDTLCIYSGDNPPRSGADNDDMLTQEIAYVEVTAVNGLTISYMQAAVENVLARPDTLPIYVGTGSPVSGYAQGGTSFTVNLEDLNFSQYTMLGLTARTTVDAGDYLFFYTNPDFFASATPPETDFLGYGKVSAVSRSTDGYAITVTYEAVTQAEMQESIGYYTRTPVSGETLLQGADIIQLENSIEQQALDSGFAEQAALYMASVAMATDSFGLLASEGADAASGSINTAAISPLAVGSPIVNIDVSISDNPQKISSDGIRAVVTVNYEVPVTTEGGDITISGSATFTQELHVSLDASGNFVWDHWLFIYWVKDYSIYAYTNVYTYTGFSFDVYVQTAGSGTSFDVSNEIKAILSSTDANQLTANVADILNRYCELINIDNDWIELVDRSLVDERVSILFGLVQLKLEVSFVLHTYVNAALGSSFEYSEGTSYVFYGNIIARNFRSYTQDLMDEQLTFCFYALGEMGLKAGLRLELAAGLLICDIDSVGYVGETGLYGKIYGYFYYEYQELNGVSSSVTAGAPYFELGRYATIDFVSQAFGGILSSTRSLYDKEWPLLSAGSRTIPYDFALADTHAIILKYNETISLPAQMFTLRTMDLKDGQFFDHAYPIEDFNITLSNDKFRIIEDPNGAHRLTVSGGRQEGDRRIRGNMTITYKHSTVPFSSMPITRTYDLEWNNLSDYGYNICYDSNGGTYIPPTNADYEAAVSAPPPPIRAGYDFGGWYADYDLKTAYVFTTMPAETVYVYAKWIPRRDTVYVIRHYQQNLTNDLYTLVDTDRFTDGYSGEMVQVKNLRRYYTGFDAPAFADGTPYDINNAKYFINIAGDGSTVVELYYKRSVYHMQFIASGDETGNRDVTLLIKYGANINAPSVWKPGWRLAAWQQLGGGAALPATQPERGGVYYAEWQKETYTVTFDSLGGTSCNPITVSYGDEYAPNRLLPEPAPAPNSGKEFAGWYLAKTVDSITGEATGSGTQVYEDSTVNIAGSHTLYAGWRDSREVVFGINYYLKDSTGNYTLRSWTTRNVPLNTSFTVPTKTFTGYTTPESVTVTVEANGPRQHSYYYDQIGFTLTLYIDEGVSYSTQTYGYGDTIPAVTAPTKTGYTFTGWEPELPATMPADNFSATAQWERKWYYITLDGNGGSPVSGYAYVGYDSMNIPTTNPTRSGYAFTGWYTAADGGTLLLNPDGTFNAIEENTAYITQKTDGKYYWTYDDDLTLYAGWEEIQTAVVNSLDDLVAALQDPSNQVIEIAQMIFIESNIESTGSGQTILYSPSNDAARIMVVNGGSLTLSNVTINCRGRIGIDVGAQSSLRLEGVTLRDASPYAVKVTGEASAAIINCTFENTMGENVFNDGTGTVSYQDNGGV